MIMICIDKLMLLKYISREHEEIAIIFLYYMLVTYSLIEHKRVFAYRKDGLKTPKVGEVRIALGVLDFALKR